MARRRPDQISENGCLKKRGAFFFLPLKKLLELSAPQFSASVVAMCGAEPFQELQGSTLKTIVCHCSCFTRVDESAHVSMPLPRLI
jgi:hypothetical protein